MPSCAARVSVRERKRCWRGKAVLRKDEEGSNQEPRLDRRSLAELQVVRC